MRRDAVDYFLVPDGQLEIHSRLEDWARWVKVRPHGWQVAPMFRQYRSKAWQWEAPVVRAQLNIPEALEIERTVSALPDKHRTALRWCYVICSGPSAVCRDLGVSKSGLATLISEGRQMVVNRLRRSNVIGAAPEVVQTSGATSQTIVPRTTA